MSKMANISLIKLGTGSSPAGTLTLVPRGVNPTNGVASLSESGSVPALEKRVTISVSQPSRNRKNFKVQVKIQNPTSVDPDGVNMPKDAVVTRQAFADLSFTFTQYSTAEERGFIRTELAALLLDGLLVDAIDGLNPAY